jgi:hypothetical protein
MLYYHALDERMVLVLILNREERAAILNGIVYGELHYDHNHLEDLPVMPDVVAVVHTKQVG